MNFAAAGGALPSVTPAFLGFESALGSERAATPGDASWEPRRDLARELLALLTDAQRRTVIIEAEAPEDIVTGNARTVELDRFEGLPASAMNDAQRKALMHVIEEYLNNANAEVADAEMQRIHEAGLENLHFAWAGGTERGEGHYYRIHRTHPADRVRQRSGWSPTTCIRCGGTPRTTSETICSAGITRKWSTVRVEPPLEREHR